MRMYIRTYGHIYIYRYSHISPQKGQHILIHTYENRLNILEPYIFAWTPIHNKYSLGSAGSPLRGTEGRPSRPQPRTAQRRNGPSPQNPCRKGPALPQTPRQKRKIRESVVHIIFLNLSATAQTPRLMHMMRARRGPTSTPQGSEGSLLNEKRSWKKVLRVIFRALSATAYHRPSQIPRGFNGFISTVLNGKNPRSTACSKHTKTSIFKYSVFASCRSQQNGGSDRDSQALSPETSSMCCHRNERKDAR